MRESPSRPRGFLRWAQPRVYSDHLDVPHGAVTTVAYRSKTLGLNRLVNVYTPPGYETSTTRYPVLYLLHGAGNRFDTWVSADAASIMDNLLAKKGIVPMIVVMPNGHVAPGARVLEGAHGEGLQRHESDFGDNWITWRRDLNNEVAPKLFR